MWHAFTDPGRNRAPRSLSLLCHFLLASPTSASTGWCPLDQLLASIQLVFGLKPREQEAFQRSFLMRLGVLKRIAVSPDEPVSFLEFDNIMKQMVHVRRRIPTPEDPVMKAKAKAEEAARRQKRREEQAKGDSQSESEGTQR